MNDNKNYTTNTDCWNDNIEKVLNEIREKCIGYKHMSMYTSTREIKKYNYLIYTSIVLASISGILSSTTTNSKFCETNYITVAQVILTILTFTSATIQTVLKFTKYQEKSTTHRSVGAKYASLENNIQRQLSLDRNDRVNPGQYLEYIFRSFDELYSSTPLIPDDIYDEWVNYAKKHNMVIPNTIIPNTIIDNSNKTNSDNNSNQNDNKSNQNDKNDKNDKPNIADTNPVIISVNNPEYNHYSDTRMQYELNRFRSI